MRPPEEGSCDPGLVLPHSLHAFHHVYPTEKLNMVRFLYDYYDLTFLHAHGQILVGYFQEGCHTFQGGFWNYFSMGKNFS